MMKKALSGPATSRAAVLATDLRVVIGKLKRRLRGAGNFGDFSGSQTSVISRLDRDGAATVTALAQAEGVRPQSMGATVAALEAEGLVRGTPDPQDGRKTLLSLTQTCRERLRVGRAAGEDWLLKNIQQKLSPTEQESLAHSIALLERLVDT